MSSPHQAKFKDQQLSTYVLSKYSFAIVISPSAFHDPYRCSNQAEFAIRQLFPCDLWRFSSMFEAIPSICHDLNSKNCRHLTIQVTSEAMPHFPYVPLQSSYFSQVTS